MFHQIMENELTSQQYWENYYGNDHTDRAHIINVCSYYDQIWQRFIDQRSKNHSILEIGGYPGRYLAYLSSKYGLFPCCLDFNSDVKQISASFKAMDVKDYKILQEDFIKFIPGNQYNYVLSNGFIEHFKNFDEILDLHLNHLKNNGKLLVMIPNMKGYIRFYKYFVDYKNLKLHNLNSMSLEVFKHFAIRNQLKIEYLSYFGEFPYNVHQPLNIIQKIIYKSHRLLFKQILNKFIFKYPTPYFSSSIIAIFKKE